MSAVVSLREVVDEMLLVGDRITAYLHRTTGELATLSEDDIDAADRDAEELEDWRLDHLPRIQEILDSDDWLELPSRSEIDEQAIMRRFAETLPDPGRRRELERALDGHGAFRRFKDAARELGVEEGWSRFRAEAFAEVAVAWLEDNGIPFERDDTGG